MIVADADVIVYRFVQGPFSPLAAALLKNDPDWRTSALWRYEFANAMAVMLRAGALTEGDALEAIAHADAQMTARETVVRQDQALRVAARSGVSAYDAQYIALAQTLGVRCVTADTPLARKTAPTCVLLSHHVK